MSELTDLQRRLLVAALRSGGCITVIVTADYDVSVRADSELMCDSAAPMEPLVAMQLVELAGKQNDLQATFPGGEIQGVLLYQLTAAGRAVAMEVMDVEVGRRAADGGEPLGRSEPEESDN